MSRSALDLVHEELVKNSKSPIALRMATALVIKESTQSCHTSESTCMLGTLKKNIYIVKLENF